MTKYNIVKIGDRYALKRTELFIFVSYLDLKTPSFWWNKTSKYFGECLGSLENVERWHQQLAGQEIIIK